jgi:hypothetical protein
VAFGGVESAFDISWATYPQFQNNVFTVQSFVCSAKLMPQSLIAYYNFWNNYFALAPDEPHQLAAFSESNPGQPAWTRFGTCN